MRVGGDQLAPTRAARRNAPRTRRWRRLDVRGAIRTGRHGGVGGALELDVGQDGLPAGRVELDALEPPVARVAVRPRRSTASSVRSSGASPTPLPASAGRADRRPGRPGRRRARAADRPSPGRRAGPRRGPIPAGPSSGPRRPPADRRTRRSPPGTRRRGPGPTGSRASSAAGPVAEPSQGLEGRLSLVVRHRTVGPDDRRLVALARRAARRRPGGRARMRPRSPPAGRR